MLSFGPMRRWLPQALAVAAGLAACSEEPVVEVPSAAERDAARALVDQTRALASLAGDPRDAKTLLRATSSEAITRLVAPAGTQMVMPSRSAAETSDLAACATVTANTVSFSECAMAEHVVDGTVSRQGDEIVVDLDDVFVLDAGLHGAASVSGRVATTAGELTGSLSIDAQSTVEGEDTLVDATLRLDEIALDAAGCPVAGTMLVTADRAGPEGGGTHAIHFGPSCGDVTLTR